MRYKTLAALGAAIAAGVAALPFALAQQPTPPAADLPPPCIEPGVGSQIPSYAPPAPARKLPPISNDSVRSEIPCLPDLATGTALPQIATPACPEIRQVEAPAGCGLSRLTQPRVPTLLVNSRRLKLNYTIKDVGPSGVSRLELWATRDGKNWARYSNEPPPSGPLAVQVAEEGKYGFAVVVTNGVGVRSTEPKTGDTPHLWVVVDETAPVVKMHGVDVLPEGKLVVRWSAADERLTPRPVTISVSEKAEGPFTPVATAVENCGRHVHMLPKDHPYEFFVRVEAADKAGNVGHDTTATPVKVDLKRPQGVIIGVDAEKHVHVPVAIPAESKKPDGAVLNFLIGFAR